MNNVIRHPSSPLEVQDWIKGIVEQGGDVVAIGIIGEDCGICATDPDEVFVHYIVSRAAHAIMSGDPGYE